MKYIFIWYTNFRWQEINNNNAWDVWYIQLIPIYDDFNVLFSKIAWGCRTNEPEICSSCCQQIFLAPGGAKSSPPTMLTTNHSLFLHMYPHWSEELIFASVFYRHMMQECAWQRFGGGGGWVVGVVWGVIRPFSFLFRATGFGGLMVKFHYIYQNCSSSFGWYIIAACVSTSALGI